MRYIRTADGVYKVIEECFKPTKNNVVFIPQEGLTRILKQADTIEELICDDDILYIYDLYPDAVLVVEGNIKPFGYQEAIKLKKWLDYKVLQFDLFIKDSKGNYIKRATTNDKGELELL